MTGGREMLRVEDLSKSFGGVRALDGVSLVINEGEMVGLIGPNGSGKTTLFNVISGIYRPDSGRVFFMGEDVTGMPPYELYKRGLVRGFQVPRLWRKMVVSENAAVAYRVRRGGGPLSSVLGRRGWLRWEAGELSSRVASVLSRLSLDGVAMNWASDISGGQMKLTDLSRALLGGARLLLLDEPTAGVAPKLSRDIFEVLRGLNREGLTIFVIEHKLEVLFDYVDRVIVMHEGRVLVEGSPGDVARDPRVLEAYLGSL